MHTPVWTGRAGQLAAWDRYDQGHLVDVRTGRTGLALESGLGGAAGAWHVRWRSTPPRVVGQLRRGGSVGDVGSAHRGRDPIRRLCQATSASTSRSGRLVLWSDGSQLRTVRASDRHVMARRGGIVAGAVSPAGVVAASGADGSLIFLDLHTLRPRGRPLPDAPGTIEQFAFSRDGSLLAARSPDGTVRLIDMASRTQLGEPIRRHLHGQPHHCAATGRPSPRPAQPQGTPDLGPPPDALADRRLPPRRPRPDQRRMADLPLRSRQLPTGLPRRQLIDGLDLTVSVGVIGPSGHQDPLGSMRITMRGRAAGTPPSRHAVATGFG